MAVFWVFAVFNCNSYIDEAHKPDQLGTPTYTVGGFVCCVYTGSLVLENNGSDEVVFTGFGYYTFPTPLKDNETYDVTVKRNPPGQVCMVHNSAGTISGAYVKNVNVQCASDTNWVQDAYLKASNAEGGDNFGTSVAISGSTIVVGAWSQDSNQTTITNADGQPGLPDNDDASNSGAVYVFKAF